MMRTATFCISLLLSAAVGIAAGVAAGLPAAAQSGERTFRFEGVSLRSSLDSLRKWFPVPIIFLDSDIEGKSITASCDGCGFEESLSRILAGTDLTWVRMDGQVILRRIVAKPPRPVASISGTIRDSLTGEPLAGANVLLYGGEGEGPLRWCSTNPFGYYSLRNIPAGGYALRIRSMGYRTMSDSLTVALPDPVDRDATLAQESIPLQEVTVEGHRTEVRPAAGLTRGVYIRSAPVDQTEYLIDGARIYNPTHVGGVLSTFNPEALNEIELQSGGIPPYYGGRLGGILDLSLRSGRDDRFSGTLGSGSLGTHGSVEGPLGPRTSFLLSVRRGYPNLVVPGLEERDAPNRLGSTELIGHLTHAPTGKERLLLSAYLSRDSYSNAVGGGGGGWGVSNTFAWENALVNLRWVGIVSSSLFLHASAAYTRYHLTLEHEFTDPETGSIRQASGYTIEDFSLRGHAEHYYDEHHTVRGGVELIRHRIAGGVNPFATRLAPFAIEEPSAWELSVYMQDQWRIVPSVTAELGARATTFTARSGSFSSVDPRFSLLIEPGGAARFFTSITAVNQFIHPYRSTGIFAFYPTLFWYPSSEAIRPTTAIHVTGGMIATSEDGAYEGIVEGFHRAAQGLHEPDTLGTGGAGTGGTGTGGPSAGTGLMDLLRSGSGRSYGLQLIVRKRTGAVTGSLSYAWSKSELRFPALNGGGAFVPRFDRRHEIQGTIHYTPDGRWNFGVEAVIVPGFDFTGDTEAEADQSKDARTAAAAFESRNLMSEAEGNRLPGFQRLEFSVGYRAAFAGIPGVITLRLMNSYGLLDPIAWDLIPVPGSLPTWRGRLRSLSLFPLFPVVDCTVQL